MGDENKQQEFSVELLRVYYGKYYLNQLLLSINNYSYILYFFLMLS